MGLIARIVPGLGAGLLASADPRQEIPGPSRRAPRCHDQLPL
jgi:hypothetical protein